MAHARNLYMGFYMSYSKHRSKRGFLELDLIQNDRLGLFDLCIISYAKNFAPKIDVL